MIFKRYDALFALTYCDKNFVFSITISKFMISIKIKFEKKTIFNNLT